MRNISILIFILLSLSNCQTNNKKSTTIESKEKLKYTGELIGYPLRSISEKEKELGIKLEFELIESIDYDFNRDGKNDYIKVEKIKDWGDPGDFHKVTINMSGNDERVFFNEGGWITIGDYEKQFIEGSFSKSIINSNYITILKSSNEDILLFCFGYVYASQPGLLSILNLSRFNKPELIFNDNYHLYDLEDKNKDGTLDIVVTKYDKDELKELNSRDILKTYLLKNGCFQSLHSSGSVIARDKE